MLERLRLDTMIGRISQNRTLGNPPALRLLDIWYMIGHANPKTAGPHDWRQDEVNVGEIEKIGI